MKNVFIGLLAVASILLAYMCYRSVMNPIEFAEQKAIRDKAVIEQLVNIRKAQIAHKEATGEYATSMKQLVKFVDKGSIPNIVKKGELTDDQMKAGLTEELAIRLLPEDAAKYGIGNYDSFVENFRRDTVLVGVKEKVFHDVNFDAKSIAVVPFGEGQEFLMTTNNKFMTSSNVEVPLFEACIPYDVYLKGLNKQEIINLNEKANTLGKYAGLKVGDVTSPNNNSGNWE